MCPKEPTHPTRLHPQRTIRAVRAIPAHTSKVMKHRINISRLSMASKDTEEATEDTREGTAEAVGLEGIRSEELDSLQRLVDTSGSIHVQDDDVMMRRRIVFADPTDESNSISGRYSDSNPNKLNV